MPPIHQDGREPPRAPGQANSALSVHSVLHPFFPKLCALTCTVHLRAVRCKCCVFAVKKQDAIALGIGLDRLCQCSQTLEKLAIDHDQQRIQYLARDRSIIEILLLCITFTRNTSADRLEFRLLSEIGILGAKKIVPRRAKFARLPPRLTDVCLCRVLRRVGLFGCKKRQKLLEELSASCALFGCRQGGVQF